MRTVICDRSCGRSRPGRARADGSLLAGAMGGPREWLWVSLALGVALRPHPAWACAACYGQSDSPLAAGMNWGIFSLLGTITVVLGGVAAFFIYLAKRSAAAGSAATPTSFALGASATLPCARRAGLDRHPRVSRLLRRAWALPALARRRRNCAHAGGDLRPRGGLGVRRL
jgi:hypothetical protein